MCYTIIICNARTACAKLFVCNALHALCQDLLPDMNINSSWRMLKNTINCNIIIVYVCISQCESLYHCMCMCLFA